MKTHNRETIRWTVNPWAYYKPPWRKQWRLYTCCLWVAAYALAFAYAVAESL